MKKICEKKVCRWFLTACLSVPIWFLPPGIFAAEPETAHIRAEIREVTDWYEAVGTVRPRTESSIEARVTAQVIDVKVRPGNKVEKGALLVVLDNRQFLSRIDQAKQGLMSAEAARKQADQGVAAAKAAFDQADADYKRIQTYFKSQAATSRDLEKAESAWKQAKAGLERAREARAGTDAMIRQAKEVVKEAEISMDYTRITAPEGGEVLRRMVEPGDMALPGKPLLVLQTAGSLRLEAHVREGLIGKIRMGEKLKVVIDTLETTVDSVVEEIVPYADPQTRTFLVKTSLPRMERLYPGMFGKLLIPTGEYSVVLVPRASVRLVGQLELIRIRENDEFRTCYIKTGKTMGDMVEVLSGLSGNEIIGE